MLPYDSDFSISISMSIDFAGIGVIHPANANVAIMTAAASSAVPLHNARSMTATVVNSAPYGQP